MDENNIYKVILIGDASVGKTSILNKYVNGTFKEGFIAPSGIVFKVKRMDVDKRIAVLQIWDQANPAYLRNF